MNSGNNLRTNLFYEWVKSNMVYDVKIITSMQVLHSAYTKYCEDNTSIPYKRKYFAYLLKQYLLASINGGKVLIYHSAQVMVKGVKLNNQNNNSNG